MACADWLMQAWISSRDGCSTTEGAVKWTFTSKKGCTEGGGCCSCWSWLLWLFEGAVVRCVCWEVMHYKGTVHTPAGGGGGVEEGARGDALLEGVHAVLGAMQEGLTWDAGVEAWM